MCSHAYNKPTLSDKKRIINDRRFSIRTQPTLSGLEKRCISNDRILSYILSFKINRTHQLLYLLFLIASTHIYELCVIKSAFIFKISIEYVILIHDAQKNLHRKCNRSKLDSIEINIR